MHCFPYHENVSLYFEKDFLRDLWRQITDTGSKLELQSHRFRLKTYPNCFVGHELVDWLLTYGKAANRYILFIEIYFSSFVISLSLSFFIDIINIVYIIV